MSHGSFMQTASPMHHARHERSAVCEAPNVGFAERMVSATVGGALVMAGLKRFSFGGLVTAVLGEALVHRGVTGVCQLYKATGMNTAQPQSHAGVRAQHGVKIEKSITIHRSPHELFAFWRDFSNLPRVMEHLLEVRPLTDRRSQWTAKGPLDSRLQWQAEIINEREPDLIAWQSVGSGDVSTAGSIHFMPAAGGSGTLVHVSMKYDPPGGTLGVKAAEFLQQDLERMLDNDLRQFKTLMESETPAVTAHPEV